MRINRTFTAVIEQLESGTAKVTWDQSVAFFGSTKSVKVRGTVDGVPFQTAFLPWGDGTQFLPINKKLLAAIDKQPGAKVTVVLTETIAPTTAAKLK